MPCVDTLSLLERDARRRQRPITAGSLTLDRARADRGLPRYPHHNALWDAISAAELWLALNAEYRRGDVDLRLGGVARIFP